MSHPRARIKKKQQNPNFGKHPSLRTDRKKVNGKYINV